MSINIPLLLMMVLTMIVWLTLYVRRLRWIQTEKIDLDAYATRATHANIPARVQQPSDNFQNLFELPVLFYVLIFYIAWGNEVSTLDVVLAYTFVATRYAHSFIQCTYNNVLHRFLAYVAGAIALWIMLITTIWGMFFY